VIACAAGAGAKESIATAPLVVALYDRAFLFGSFRAALASRRRLYAGLLLAWVLVAFVVAAGPRSAVVGWSSGVSAWTYLLNQAQLIPHYVRLSVWPDGLIVFYGWPEPLTFGDAAVGFVLLTALVLAAAIAFWRIPPIGFLGISFFITLAPASSIVPVSTEVGAERRMYLPLIALVALIVVAIFSLVRRLMRPSEPSGAAVRLLPALITGVVAAMLAGVTVARTRDYASPVTLAQTVVDRRPTGVAHHILGEQLVLADRGDEAVPHLREAVAKGDSRAGFVLGRLLVEQGRHVDAIPVLEAFLKTANLPYRLVPRWLEPPVDEVVLARYDLARAHGLRGDWNRAEEQARRIISIAPQHPGARGVLGDAAFARQEWNRAAEHYRAYLARWPNDVQALVNLGICEVAAERLDEAIAIFTRATRLDPADERAKRLLAFAQDDRAKLQPAGR
jgi:tetratricopeptide (TPR) repeat protein